MSSPALAHSPPRSAFELLHVGREVLQTEATALQTLAKRLPVEFADAVRLIEGCQGSVIVTGMGKAGLIGQKIAATFSSTGTPAHFVHPAEALHGDLGRIRPIDVVVALSHSGETEEIVRILPSLAEVCGVIAITSSPRSQLARAASVLLSLGALQEACPLGLAPTTSTTLMLALGDALALTVSRCRGFRREDFARFHPGGSLGRKLSQVEQHMRTLEECRVASEALTVREVLVHVSRPGRRSGAIMLIDESQRLTGLFTDSDVARLLEQRRDEALDQPVREVMTQRPITIPLGAKLASALQLMAERKLSELPVLDVQGQPRGILDITDVVGLMPAEGGMEHA